MEMGHHPVPCICSGVVSNKINASSWEVTIYNSPIGEFSGPIPAGLIYQPGAESNFKRGDYVKVMVTFLFGGPKYEFRDVAPQSDAWILGAFQEKQLVDTEIEPGISKIDDNTVGLRHPFSKAGFVAHHPGHVSMSTQGENFIFIRNGGYGTLKNSISMRAQCFTRIISHNRGVTAKDQFLKYDGADSDEESANTTPDSRILAFRRFLPNNQDITSWVSSYEGSCVPFVPANTDFNEVNVSKDCVWGKVIQSDDVRLTMEAGELGDKFFRLRVDKVQTDEKSSTVGAGATPAILGSLAKFNFGDDGSIEIQAGGDGNPIGNTYSASIKISEDGIVVNSKKNITFTHGDKDEQNNSIVMDPSKGIDVTALNGFRVNGQEIVLKAFIDWMNTYQAALCQVTSVGGPAPISVAALPEFNIGVQSFGNIGGFTSIGISAPSTGLITEQPDDFSSV